ncbi:MAG: hypothetical protein U0R44_06165 [Candidatus Micrarchaeia archaeon]
MEAKPAAAPAQPAGGSGASNDSRLWAGIGYPIWLLPILVLVTDKKNDKWLLFHAYQALLLGVAIFIVVSITSFFLLGCIIWPLAFLAQLYFGYKAYKGERFKLPMIGDMAEGYAK